MQKKLVRGIFTAKDYCGFTENFKSKVALIGNTAKVARERLEAETGKSVVSSLNAKDLGNEQLKITDGEDG